MGQQWDECGGDAQGRQGTEGAQEGQRGTGSGRPARTPRRRIVRHPVPWDDLPRLMTLGQAASGLGMAETSLRKILDTTPDLAALVEFRPGGGGARRIKREPLQRWLAGQWLGGAAPETAVGDAVGRFLRRRQRASGE